VLQGKRIVLDPGHGGFFRGSLGVHGLTEAEVNLGVGLELERLLTAHGATVLMTRREDRDFLTRADSSLRADLAERVRMANAFHPDFFLSIHHNADPSGTHDKNETETYYKLGDEGPSLDAAASIHRYLRRNLGIEKSRIVAGNYFVLRNSESPAVLTEASYLTNPDVEARLDLPEKRRLEAEALYLGLIAYFSRRPPVVEAFFASQPGQAPDTFFREIDGPRLEALVRGTYDRAALELDGESAPLTQSAQTLVWEPSRALDQGHHEARLTVMLAGVGSAAERRVSFSLVRGPAALRATLVPPHPARLAAVRIALLDRAGLPSLDSLAILVRASRAGVSPAETTVYSRDGVGWAYLRLSPKLTTAGPLASASIRGRTTGPKASVALPAPSSKRAPWVGWALRMPEDRRLRDAPGTREPTPAVRWINRDGFVTLPRDSAAAFEVPRLPGYRAWGDTMPPLRFVAVAGGALQGRRILLDPDGGGEDSGGMGASGTRAAFYNMDVAQALASYLIAAGAEVRLARTGDYAASDVERVRAGERFGADRYLRIGHRAEPPHAGYYFSSSVGRRWAQRTAAWLGRLGWSAPPVTEDAQYPLQQSSCPAIYVSTARVDDPAGEARMNAAGAVRSEAYALFLGLLGEWSEADLPVDSLRVHDAQGRPSAGAIVTLGEAFVLQADGAGVVHFVRTEPGPLEARAEHPAVHARALLLDSQRGVDMTGPVGR
jgi:N-acetylmuramoyl-L-alanine amidase